jgi:hypothetical protein
MTPLVGVDSAKDMEAGDEGVGCVALQRNVSRNMAKVGSILESVS